MFTKDEATDYVLPLTRFSEEDNVRLTDIDIIRDRVLQKLNKLDPTKAPELTAFVQECWLNWLMR